MGPFVNIFHNHFFQSLKIESSIVVIILMVVVSLFFVSHLEAATARTPSQALPKMFQKPPATNYYDMKKQQEIIPEIPQINIEQQEDTGITITPQDINYLSTTRIAKNHICG